MQRSRIHAQFKTDPHIDNIDYNSIKQLIKDNTSPGQGKAVSIPGTGDSVEKDFSNQLFVILNGEHDRISLFIKSRWYEINSRLGKWLPIGESTSIRLITLQPLLKDNCRRFKAKTLQL